MKIKQSVGPLRILKTDRARSHFCYMESGHWLDIIDTNYNISLSERIQVVMIELLENAVFCNKYDDSNIEYEIEIISNEVTIKVTNKVDAEQKKSLVDKISRFNNCDDLNREYAKAMDENDEGGIGILRLMTEQNCILKVKEKDFGYIEIIARMEL